MLEFIFLLLFKYGPLALVLFFLAMSWDDIFYKEKKP